MSDFIKYPKVHRLGKEETDGILEGSCVIQEKIDGANVSLWWSINDDMLHMGSRNREVLEGFNGFVEYVKGHVGIERFFKHYPLHRLYGEWLVKHTVAYDSDSYKHLYIYDVVDEEGKLFHQDEVGQLCDSYGLLHAQVFGEFSSLTLPDIKVFVGSTNLGPTGEGVVIKNLEHRDKWGRHCHAKVVTEKFHEESKLAFGGNDKSADCYWEMYVVNKYINIARVQKIMGTLQDQIEERLDLKHTPRIANTVYHDVITEEAWDIAKKVVFIDYKKLKSLSLRKAITIYKSLILDDVGVGLK